VCCIETSKHTLKLYSSSGKWPFYSFFCTKRYGNSPIWTPNGLGM